MKFFKYKQIARVNFMGYDDELNDVASSYYNTKFKLFNNIEINTKLLRFRINNLRDLKLSQNARIVLESCYIPTILENTLEPKHNANVILRFKNISDSKCYDSSNDNNGSTIIFSHSIQSRVQSVTSLETSTVDLAGLTTYVSQLDNYNKYDLGISFINPAPEKSFNFYIPNTFTNSTQFEFEIVYDMRLNVDIDRPTDRGEFYKFQCSLIICDYDEDELISNDSNIVNYDKYKTHFPLKKSF
jgi:hypothetical protein